MFASLISSTIPNEDKATDLKIDQLMTAVIIMSVGIHTQT